MVDNYENRVWSQNVSGKVDVVSEIRKLSKSVQDLMETTKNTLRKQDEKIRAIEARISVIQPQPTKHPEFKQRYFECMYVGPEKSSNIGPFICSTQNIPLYAYFCSEGDLMYYAMIPATSQDDVYLFNLQNKMSACATPDELCDVVESIVGPTSTYLIVKFFCTEGCSELTAFFSQLQKVTWTDVKPGRLRSSELASGERMQIAGTLAGSQISAGGLCSLHIDIGKK